MKKAPKTRKKTKPYDGVSPITLRYRKLFLEKMMLGETNLPQDFADPTSNIPEFFIEILEHTFDFMKLKKSEASVQYYEDKDFVFFTIVPHEKV